MYAHIFSIEEADSDLIKILKESGAVVQNIGAYSGGKFRLSVYLQQDSTDASNWIREYISPHRDKFKKGERFCVPLEAKKVFPFLK